MRMLKSKCFSAVLCVGLAGFIGSSLWAQEQQYQEKQQIEKVVHQFWKAFSKTDFDGLKNTLAWPSIMQEVTPTSISDSTVYRSASDVDEERKHYQTSTDDKANQGQFTNIAISDVKITILNQSVASVNYKCTFPQLKIFNPKEHAKTLSMLTVLQKQPLQKAWKITYTTVPQ